MARTLFKAVMTPLGRRRIKFTDRYGQACSLQESSLAGEPAIWLGVDRDIDGRESNRMHLTIAHVHALLPALQTFVDTGRLSHPEVDRLETAR